jgi:DNA-binding transcriptional LysR family regulator
LTVAPPAADFVLAPVIARFLSLYPEISVDVSVDRGIVDIVAERFDAGIRPGESIARDMIALRISDEMPFVVIASPKYLRQHGTPRLRSNSQNTLASVCASQAARWRPGASARNVERLRFRLMDS